MIEMTFKLGNDSENKEKFKFLSFFMAKKCRKLPKIFWCEK
jgi:hypothetical protein